MMGTPPDGKSPARLSQNDVHLECKKKKKDVAVYLLLLVLLISE